MAYGIGCSSYRTIEERYLPPEPFLISCSFLVALAMCGELTDSHFNPTVSIAAHIAHKSKTTKLNILAQISGGFLGVLFYYICTGNIFIPVSDCEGGINTMAEKAKFCVNEVVGSFFFSIFVLTLTNKYTNAAFRSWQVYLSLPIALFIVR